MTRWLVILAVALSIPFSGCHTTSTADDALHVCGQGNVSQVDEDSDDFECNTETVTIPAPEETVTVP